MHLEDKRLNLKEGSIPSLFPSKEDIDAGSERLGRITESISCCYTSTPSSKQCECMAEEEQDQGQRPCNEVLGVVYKIPCSCGPKYTGVTKRALEMHLKEHQAATRRGETEKSAITEHAWSRHHQPLWEETRILNRARNTTTLLIKETIHISLRHPAELLNRDQGLDSDCCWKNLARRPPKRQQNRAQSRGVEPR